MVLYPNMREELINAMRTLSDVEYQQRAWIEHIFPVGIQYDEFSISLNIIEDVGFFEKTEPKIGGVIENLQELIAVERVAYAIEYMFNCRGNNRTDAEYMADPLWSVVVGRAAKALKILSLSD